MDASRRRFLQLGAATAAGAVLGGHAGARDSSDADARWGREGLGLLYDATRCIGCMTCMVACKEANHLPPDPAGRERLWDNPRDLSARSKTVIKFARTEEGHRAFLKVQCMHCVHPACTSVCMLAALHKDEHGVVAYDPSRCIGCRYCQVACPFDVPRFEWDTPAPKIVKCELCRHRPGFPEQSGPACAEVCPRHAIRFGRREDLLAEARRRIRAEPGRYVGHIYGEHEGGGTQVLILSAVPFEETCLPRLGDEPAPALAEAVQHGVYRGFLAPVALYAVLAGILWRNRRRGPEGDEG